MKRILSLAILLVFTIKSLSQNIPSDSITTFYLIRHAEKDRSDSNNKNPHLTDIGKARAQHWNNILKHVKFDAVYSTDYFRTRETALPTANSNKLGITLYNPNELHIETFKKDNLGKHVLIVGHSNTTPALVNKIIGKNEYDDINDSNNGNLYIVTISNDVISHMVLEINNQ